MGKYFGWVRLDGAEPWVNRYIWSANFPRNLEYLSIVVNPGVEGCDTAKRTYKLLKNTPYTVPECIYGYDVDATGGFFAGWKMESEHENRLVTPGEKLVLTEDVSFTPYWINIGEIPVTIEWHDGDDADALRPSELALNVYPDLDSDSHTTFTVKTENGWKGFLTGNVSRMPG